MNRPLSWLPQGSVPALRDALAKVAPELAGRPIAVNERVVTSDPRFFQGSAVVDSAFVVKFAWSEPAARRVALEGAVLTALGRAAPDLAIPEVVVASADPALVVTLRILGEPLTSEVARRHWDDWALRARSPRAWNRIPQSDAQVRSHIVRMLASDAALTKTAALRRLRDEGVACEQKRFGVIFTEISGASSERIPNR